MTSDTPVLCSIRSDLRSLAIHAGEMILLTGAVGCGKTRMLHRLAGLASFPPSVTLEQNGAGVPVMTRILFDHSPPLWLAPKLGEELVFGLHPIPAADEMHRVRKAWRLEALADSTPVEALNRVQAIRLMLAAMELGETRLALLDNPTASLPLDDAEALRNDIDAWMERSACAVVIACNRGQDWLPWVQQIWRLGMDEDMPEAGQRHD